MSIKALHSTLYSSAQVGGTWGECWGNRHEAGWTPCWTPPASPAPLQLMSRTALCRACWERGLSQVNQSAFIFISWNGTGHAGSFSAFLQCSSSFSFGEAGMVWQEDLKKPRHCACILSLLNDFSGSECRSTWQWCHHLTTNYFWVDPAKVHEASWLPKVGLPCSRSSVQTPQEIILAHSHRILLDSYNGLLRLSRDDTWTSLFAFLETFLWG